MLETALFWTFSILGLAGGIGLILNRNPVHAALSLILNFFSIAGLYLSLQAEFLAIIQILVYAGAIMVLFLFVIMLLNLSEEPRTTKYSLSRGMAFILALAFIGEMLYVFYQHGTARVAGDFSYGTVEEVGKLLMTDFLFPFEIISVILIASLIGSIVIAKKHSYKND